MTFYGMCGRCDMCAQYKKLHDYCMTKYELPLCEGCYRIVSRMEAAGAEVVRQ